MTPFEPIGEKPRWELVYEELQTIDVGDVLTYERLYELCDTKNRKAAQAPFYKAVNRWGSERKRAMRPVPNVGYRVVDAAEHEPIARGHHRKSRRALARSRKTLANADRSRLSPELVERFDRLEIHASRQEDAIRRLEARSAKHDAAIAESRRQHAVTTEKVEDTTKRVAQLEDTLRRHGIDPDAPTP